MDRRWTWHVGRYGVWLFSRILLSLFVICCCAFSLGAVLEGYLERTWVWVLRLLGGYCFLWIPLSQDGLLICYLI